MRTPGFEDKNGNRVTIGDVCFHMSGGECEVRDVFQDGDAEVLWRGGGNGVRGTHDTVKWNNLTLISQRPNARKQGMMNLPRVCPPDFQPQWSEDAGIVTGEYQGMKMAASTSWPHAREAIRQSLWMSAELYRLGQVPKSASEK